MTFEDALKHLKAGERIYRSGWNGKDQWVAAQYPDTLSKMTEPYAYIRNQQGGLIPWLVSQGDLFADDWEVR